MEDQEQPPINFQLLSTLLYSPSLPRDYAQSISSTIQNCYLLPFHLTRLLRAAKAFAWAPAITFLSSPDALSSLAESISAHLTTTHPTLSSSQSYRIRLLLSPSGALTIESTPIPTPSTLTNYFPSTLTPPPSIPFSKITLTPLPTLQSSFTTHKTTHRTHYTQARTLCSLDPSTPPTESEVLLYNPSHQITEASLSTIYFQRSGEWITPSAESGACFGVTRRWALDRGLCVEGDVAVEEVGDGEIVGLSNGVRGFFWGRVQIGEKG